MTTLWQLPGRSRLMAMVRWCLADCALCAPVEVSAKPRAAVYGAVRPASWPPARVGWYPELR